MNEMWIDYIFFILFFICLLFYVERRRRVRLPSTWNWRGSAFVWYFYIFGKFCFNYLQFFCCSFSSFLNGFFVYYYYRGYIKMGKVWMMNGWNMNWFFFFCFNIQWDINIDVLFLESLFFNEFWILFLF